MPATYPSYLPDEDGEIYLPPPPDYEDPAPPPALNGGRIWQNPQTVVPFTANELQYQNAPVAPPPGPSVGPDDGYEDMMQSDVPNLPPGSALPAMQRIANAGPSSAVDPASGMPSGMPPGPDYGALEKVYRDYPKLKDPKWWQRVGGAAAGFGAGWSNAASRTKNPIDIAAMRENVLHPGYGEKVAKWQAGAFPEEKVAGLKGQQQAAWFKNQELHSRMVRDQAYADYMKGLGRNGVVEVTPAIDEASGHQLKAGDHVPYTMVQHVIDNAAGKFAQNQPWPVYNPDLAKILGVPVGTKQPKWMVDEAMRQMQLENKESNLVMPPASTLYDRTNHKALYTAPGRPNEQDPLIHEQRQQNLWNSQDRASDTIANRKSADEAKVFKSRQGDVAKLIVSANASLASSGGTVDTEEDLWRIPAAAAKLKAINRQYAPALKNIEQTYEANVERNGGVAERYEINPDTLQYIRVPMSQTAAPAPNAPAPTPALTPNAPAPTLVNPYRHNRK